MKYFFYTILFGMSMVQEVAAQCRTQDSLVLVDLYNATNGANWKNRTNWITGNYNTWYGVTTNTAGCLTELALPNNQLTGILPSIFGNFSNLIRLTLNNNQLTGNIPTALYNSPNLQNLYLFKNQLTGNLVDSIVALTQLRQFDVSENRLTGNIPPSMGKLGNLQLLHLDSNRLTGTIPLSLNSLTNLWRFSAFKNLLDSLPNLNLSAFTQLTAFNVSENKLTFDDILPNLSRSLNYANQAPIFENTTYSRFAGDTLTILLGKDKAITSNVYQWYQDGKFYRTTDSSNRLIFNSLQTINAGIYTCVVTNPNAPNLTLQTLKATVLVTAITKNITLQLCEGDSHRLPKGRIVKISGIYSDTLRSWRNADSVVRTTIRVNPKYKITLSPQIVCNIRDTMTLIRNLRTVAGCDSVVIQTFRLAKTDVILEERYVCDTLLEGIDTLRLKNQMGCDSLVIRHGVFYACLCLDKTPIYNGLIPNDSDTKNNFFLIDYLERYTPNELVITDKRGMLIYKTQNYKNDWAGTNAFGEPLPAGMYNFVFRTTHPKTNQSCMRMGTIDLQYIP